MKIQELPTSIVILLMVSGGALAIAAETISNYLIIPGMLIAVILLYWVDSRRPEESKP